VSSTEEAELARLMRAAIAGNERAYEDFLHRTAGLVRGYCRSRITRGGVDPEDIVQETLLAVHIKRHTWRQESPITPWLYGIVRYKLVDAFRRRGRVVEVDIDDIAETFAAPEEDGASKRDIERVLSSLPDGQKAVVSSISVEGRSIGETASELGMKETAVRVALHRGLAAIARRFGQQ
jgi:RNA polymerase sigma-70 factor, ECF subfamily